MIAKPLIAHVLYSLRTGGMERFVATLVNETNGRYRHAIICLTQSGPIYREMAGASVPCLELHKRAGKDWGCYLRFWKTLRDLRPDVVHSYNIGTLDLAPVAKLAGVRHVIHAERGRDISDPLGRNRRYRRLRRWVSPFIARWVPVSHDLEAWLTADVGIDRSRVSCIPNGIDVRRYAGRATPADARPLTRDFAPPGTLLVMNVGRLDAIKDQRGLIDAFDRLRKRDDRAAADLRLAIVGEGSERAPLERQVSRLGLASCVRLLGNRDDVPALLAEAAIFVLSSVGEGMPGAILEAMASSLPVVATRVGGTGELVVDGETGTLVAPSDPEALAASLDAYVRDPGLRQEHGKAGRARAESRFSLDSMVSAYVALYDGLLVPPVRRPQPHPASGMAEPGEH